MALTTAQQNFLTALDARYTAFVAAFTAAYEADNDPDNLNIQDAGPLRDALQFTHGHLASHVFISPGGAFTHVLTSGPNAGASIGLVRANVGGRGASSLGNTNVPRIGV